MDIKAGNSVSYMCVACFESQLGHQLSCPQFLQANTRTVRQLGHERFLMNSFHVSDVYHATSGTVSVVNLVEARRMVLQV